MMEELTNKRSLKRWFHLNDDVALPQLKALLGDGSDIGLTLSYAEQSNPRGLADAFIVGEQFIAKDSVALILGDNIFFGQGFSETLQKTAALSHGSRVFAYYVRDPERYGVVDFDAQGRALSIEEKPKQPKSHWAVTGLYFFDNRVVEIAKNVKPSPRGEIEITDVMNAYLTQGHLIVERLGRGHAWLDTGTYDSLIDDRCLLKRSRSARGLKLVVSKRSLIEKDSSVRNN